MELFYKYMVIFFNLSPTSSHHHPLVVDEDDNGKFRLERVNPGYVNVTWLLYYPGGKIFKK